MYPVKTDAYTVHARPSTGVGFWLSVADKAASRYAGAALTEEHAAQIHVALGEWLTAQTPTPAPTFSQGDRVILDADRARWKNGARSAATVGRNALGTIDGAADLHGDYPIRWDQPQDGGFRFWVDPALLKPAPADDYPPAEREANGKLVFADGYTIGLTGHSNAGYEDCSAYGGCPDFCLVLDADPADFVDPYPAEERAANDRRVFITPADYIPHTDFSLRIDGWHGGAFHEVKNSDPADFHPAPEPEPTFAVGDRVRITSGPGVSGRVGTLAPANAYPFRVNFDGGDWEAVYEHEIEKVVEEPMPAWERELLGLNDPEPAPSPRPLHVGDRVIAVRATVSVFDRPIAAGAVGRVVIPGYRDDMVPVVGLTDGGARFVPSDDVVAYAELTDAPAPGTSVVVLPGAPGAWAEDAGRVMTVTGSRACPCDGGTILEVDGGEIRASDVGRVLDGGE